ncbi:MAG: helix-turn-helix domain-containing protein [Rhodoblastus sp.]
MTDPVKAKRYASIHARIQEDYTYIRLLQLAEITGIPRTTVRRKIGQLMQLGYVEHDAARGYRIIKGSMSNCPHLRRIMEAQIALSMRLFNVMLDGSLIEMQPREGRSRRRP